MISSGMVLSDSWNVCAVPWNDPRIEAGIAISRIARSTATLASLSDFPGVRLNEIVVAMNGPWWFTDSGVVPGPKLVNAASGTIVSRLVLTDGAEEAVLLPVAAKALVAALREELEAMLAAVVVALLLLLAALLEV